MKKIILSIVLLAVLAIVCIAANKSEPQKKEMIMVTSAGFPPYEFMVNDKIVGIDVDIVSAVAEKLGRRLNVVNVEFNPSFVHLTSGWADVVASGLTITPERKKIMLFSIPYMKSTQSIIVSRENNEIQTPEDLKKAVSIGCQYGTTACDYLNNKVYDYKKELLIQKYNSGETAVTELISGSVDAVVLDRDPAEILSKKYENEIKMLPQPLNEEEYAIAVNKKNTELLAVFNQVIAEMQANGTMKKIVEKNRKLAEIANKKSNK